MRGEYDDILAGVITDAGSPPHAWGILYYPRMSSQLRRFTPTCVGNMSASTNRTNTPTVHPHMRGEYLSLARKAAAPSGSPPHAWGILHYDGLSLTVSRFTPTCVGNTLPVRATLPHIPVHPHMRGEYVPAFHPALRPRRFTPTCVGNTADGNGAFIRHCGSPPHAWGIRAGRSAACHYIPVHPHMRGEYPLAFACLPPSAGSPPHAWGIPPPRPASGTSRRFTPTCVGNT